MYEQIKRKRFTVSVKLPTALLSNRIKLLNRSFMPFIHNSPVRLPLYPFEVFTLACPPVQGFSWFHYPPHISTANALFDDSIFGNHPRFPCLVRADGSASKAFASKFSNDIAHLLLNAMLELETHSVIKSFHSSIFLKLSFLSPFFWNSSPLSRTSNPSYPISDF